RLPRGNQHLGLRRVQPAGILRRRLHRLRVPCAGLLPEPADEIRPGHSRPERPQGGPHEAEAVMRATFLPLLKQRLRALLVAPWAALVAALLLAAAPARAENVYIMELALGGIYSVDIATG